MMLLTPELHAVLRANDAAAILSLEDYDLAPVVKLFNPCGAATWLVTELQDDDDTLFGLADLGFGCPELGYFSLNEIASIRLPFGLGIERDLSFRGLFPLSVYAEAAHRTGAITEADALLRQIAATIRKGDSELPPRGG